MRKKKKVLCFGLVLVFLLGSVSACSNPNDAQHDHMQNSTQPTKETQIETQIETKIETKIEETEIPMVENNQETIAATTTVATQEYPPMPTKDIRKIDDNNRTYYEVFLYSFCDSNGDGIGDIKGLISKLDYLNDNDPSTESDLGITGIWLMPIMPSDTYHKYDVLDYYNIDKNYGTMEDFKQLVDECERRDIKLIIDLVFNHTSNRHPWFQEAVTYLRSLEEGQEPEVSKCKYVDYYNFEKDMSSKANYHKVDHTDWYYEGVFVNSMPDLNLANQEVRSEIENIAKFWLELGVSGFRLDAAKEYFSGAHTKNIEVLSWFDTYVKSVKPDAYIVAEVWDSFGTIASYYESGIDSVFNYAFGDSAGKIVTTVKNARNGKAGYGLAQNMKQVQDIFKLRNENFIEASFISNHDNNRATSFVGGEEELTKLMGGINLMMNGSSFIYYGEEVGMTGTGRDENKRAPMYWSANDITGMTKGPSKMEKQAQIFKPVDEQAKDAASILNYYKRAIRIRNQNPEILRGEIEVIEGLDKNIAAVKKTYQEQSIIVLMNINKKDTVITLSKGQYGYEGVEVALTTTSVQPSIESEVITIPAYGIVILR